MFREPLLTENYETEIMLLIYSRMKIQRYQILIKLLILFIVNVGLSLATNQPLSNKDVDDYLGIRSLNSISLSKVTESDVNNDMRGIGKHLGNHGGMTMNVIKKVVLIIAEILACIYNISVFYGCFQ